uniref:Origin recognition complex subunit 1 n=1 Tax=Nelumbo nucifera TaxID=4432 RepID=A0A822YFV8_NELNU|nr:TPA_asm: hypothetical protein HUJ06_031313 [Nelumbo nucifera]
MLQLSESLHHRISVLVSFVLLESLLVVMMQMHYVMKNCSRLSKVFLVAMVHELYKTGMGETTFEKIATTISCLCASNGEAFPGWDVLLRVGCRLNFPSDDVAFALKDSKEIPWLAKYL